MKVAKEILQLTANADVREVFEVTLPVSPDGLPASVKNLDYKEVADG